MPHTATWMRERVLELLDGNLVPGDAAGVKALITEDCPIVFPGFAGVGHAGVDQLHSARQALLGAKAADEVEALLQRAQSEAREALAKGQALASEAAARAAAAQAEHTEAATALDRLQTQRQTAELALAASLTALGIAEAELAQRLERDDTWQRAARERLELIAHHVASAQGAQQQAESALADHLRAPPDLDASAASTALATADQRRLHDVVTCIRLGLKLDEAGSRIAANGERYLKPGTEMARLFADYREAVGEGIRLLDRIDFDLKDLRYEYPHEPVPEGWTPQSWLEHLVGKGISWRYGESPSRAVTDLVETELKLVRKARYAYYFLTVHDIVRFAREQGILCQGRGSAANSVVCYVLGITEVDPVANKLLFSRFISEDRNEPPDIDVDFEHERREEVMQYIYNRYGRDRAGLTATVISYRSRSSLRDMGKVFGVSEDTLDALSRAVWGRHAEGVEEKEAMRVGVDPHEPRLAMALKLAQEIAGFPRHLSQHTGGFVITHTRLDEVVPIANAAMENRTTVEWDKDDLDALGILKIDILALGMLSCLRRSFEFLEKHYGRALTLATIPAEEKPVYDMISKADTIGVFQIESRAQMSMLPRLRPNKFYDLVIEVAIVRPGPIQGDMVHPYLRRRQGIEPVEYPSQELESVLGKTLGVPLFQEQAMKIAIVAAGFTPSEADKLRRAMATFKRVGTLHTFHDKMVEGMVARQSGRHRHQRDLRRRERHRSRGGGQRQNSRGRRHQ